MSPQRKLEETANSILTLTKEATSLSGNIFVVVGQEIAGICRLHDLVPPFPPREQIAQMSSDAFESIASDIASAAKQLGINCFIGPVLDVVTGKNPWLIGRIWSTNPYEIPRISTAYIRSIQASGVSRCGRKGSGISRKM